MPEAAVHKNQCAVFWQNDIRLSGKVLPVEAKPVAKAMKNSPDANLRFRV